MATRDPGGHRTRLRTRRIWNTGGGIGWISHSRIYPIAAGRERQPAGRLGGFGHRLVNEGPSCELDGMVELEFIATGVVWDIDIPSLPATG